MKIPPVGAELFHEDGQTDMKLTVTFCRFAKAPSNKAENTMLQYSLLASFQILNHLNEIHDASRERYAIIGHGGDVISN
jgi:hypothetical protein